MYAISFPFPLCIEHQPVVVVLRPGADVGFIDEVLDTDRPIFADTVFHPEKVSAIVGAAACEIRVGDEAEHGIGFLVCIQVGEPKLSAVLGLTDAGAHGPARIVLLTVLYTLEKPFRRRW